MILIGMFFVSIVIIGITIKISILIMEKKILEKRVDYSLDSGKSYASNSWRRCIQFTNGTISNEGFSYFVRISFSLMIR